MTTANLWISNDLPNQIKINTPTNNIEIASNSDDFPASLTLNTFENYTNQIETDGILQSCITFNTESSPGAVTFELGDGFENTGVTNGVGAPGFAFFYGSIDLLGVFNGLLPFDFANFAVCYGNSLPATYISSVIEANLSALTDYIATTQPTFSLESDNGALTCTVQSASFNSEKTYCYYAAVSPVSSTSGQQMRVTAMVSLSAVIQMAVISQEEEYSLNLDIEQMCVYLQGNASITPQNTVSFNVTQLMTSTPTFSVSGTIFTLSMSIFESLLLKYFMLAPEFFPAIAATMAIMLKNGTAPIDPIINGPLNNGLIINCNAFIAKALGKLST